MAKNTKKTKKLKRKSCCSFGICSACPCCICICTKELKKMLTPDARKLILNALQQ